MLTEARVCVLVSGSVHGISVKTPEGTAMIRAPALSGPGVVCVDLT